MMEKDNFKDCIPNDKKGYIDGSCFISPKLLLVSSGEVIEFNTYEEYRAYIEENNLEEGDYRHKAFLFKTVFISNISKIY